MSNRLPRPFGRHATSGREGARAVDPQEKPEQTGAPAQDASRSRGAAANYRSNGPARRTSARRGRRRNPTAEILTISVLVALLVLFGVGLMLWGLESRLLMGPTPTPTATPRVPPTATPDIRATHVAEDMATQIAMLIALQTRTPEPETAPPGTQPVSPLPGVTEPTETVPIEIVPGDTEPDAIDLPPPEPETPTEEEDSESVIGLPVVGDPAAGIGNGEATIPPARTPVTVSLPVVAGEQETPTPTPTAEAVAVQPLPTETPIPTETPTEIPTEIPTETPIPTDVPTETPTPLPPPVDAPPPTPTSTPPIYTVPNLGANIHNADAVARVGPSSVYTDAGVFGANTGVNLQGRNASGEWVYACCTTGGQPAWVRQAFAIPAGNQLDDSAPEGADPNDVRWLGIHALSSVLAPLPMPTPIPVGDYPAYRYNRANQGRLSNVPRPPVNFAWPGNVAQAGGAFTSPAVVVGNSVLVASQDNHLYSFDRINGNQRWRFSVGRVLRLSPTVHEGLIYLPLEDGLVLALHEEGGQATERWRANLPGPPVTAMAVHANALYVVAGQPNNYQLVTLDRGNGTILRTMSLSGQSVTQPAIGEQLLYVGGNALTALDATLANPNAYDTIWSRGDIAGITTPPLYSQNGVRALSELYVVAGNNRIYNLDANNGRDLWSVDNGEPATGLALNQGALFVSGNGYVKAISRDNGAQLWRATVQGEILGGPIVDDEFIVIVTQVGIIQFLNAVNGNTAGGSSILSNAGGAPAVSPPYVYVPGFDGRLYALQGSQ